MGDFYIVGKCHIGPAKVLGCTDHRRIGHKSARQYSVGFLFIFIPQWPVYLPEAK